MVMLFISLFALLFIAPQSDNVLFDVKKEVREYVEDKARAKAVITLSRDLEKELQLSRSERRYIRKTFMTMHDDIDVSSEAIDSFELHIINRYKTDVESILTTRAAMRELLTQQEWESIFAIDSTEITDKCKQE